MIQQDSTFSWSQPIIVSCALDYDRDEFLVRHAALLAQRLSVPLHLVHALEPYQFQHMHSAATEFEIMPPAIETLPPGNLFRQAMKGLGDLSEIALRLDPKNTVTYNVVSGAPADAILQESRRVEGLLIVTGSSGHSSLLSVLSTTRALISGSDIPVMIINDDCSSDFSDADLSVLIADGMQNDEWPPLKRATELVARSGARLIHAHVRKAQEPLSKKLFSRFFHQHRLKETPSLLTRIKERAKLAGAADALEGKNYVPVVAEGSPETQLHELADKYAADIIVFGRHRILHLENFKRGAVPTSNMLSHKSAVMVVPS